MNLVFVRALRIFLSTAVIDMPDESPGTAYEIGVNQSRRINVAPRARSHEGEDPGYLCRLTGDD